MSFAEQPSPLVCWTAHKPPAQKFPAPQSASDAQPAQAPALQKPERHWPLAEQPPLLLPLELLAVLPLPELELLLPLLPLELLAVDPLLELELELELLLLATHWPFTQT